MDRSTDHQPAGPAHLRPDGTFGPLPGPEDPDAAATRGDVERAIARQLKPLSDALARLQQQIDYLRLGPDPW